MYDPTFGASSLERHIRKSDFKRFRLVKEPAVRKLIVEQAAEIGSDGFTNLPLQTNTVLGKTVYQLTNLSSELVLRKAVENLRTISKTRQRDRLEIVRRLCLLLEEGLPFCVAKTDIRSFYETIDQNHLKELLRRRLFTSPGTRRVLSSFIDQCAARGVAGLPRGLSISAGLSEFYTQDFDNQMRIIPYIHLYSRYVDDIIVVFQPNDESKSVRKEIARELPKGLLLNAKKTKLFEFGNIPCSKPRVEHQFDYLGFSFQVHEIGKDIPYCRKVTVDIARSKINKRKTRVVRSLLRYINDRNFDDLHDRFKLMTCNYRFYDNKHQRTRCAGFYHTYGLISRPSLGLAELDRFLRSLLLARKGKIGKPIAQFLSRSQRKELLRLSFTRGFEEKIHFHFAPERLDHLIKCWKYA